MNIKRPNYEECITNLSNSILKHFNCTTYHNTLSFIDKILDKNYKNVIVILCDGLGSKILDKHINEDSFLRKNRVREITTVFPPTTTAATTSMMSGKNPNEHGWLGWDLYFKDEDQTITMFLNTLKNSNISAQEYNVSNKTYPYENIIEKINKKSRAYLLAPFKDEKYHDFNNIVEDIYKLTLINEKKFIYAYYDNPDSLLHELGSNKKEVVEEIQKINDKIEELCSKIKNSVVIIIADHGHINSEPINLENYTSITQTLEREVSIEPRAQSFKIKPGLESIFKQEFNKYFKNDFNLLDQNEVLEQKIFGVGKNNIHFKDSIGDFVAIAIGDKYFIDNETCQKFKSMHAGLTEDEMLIPVIIKEIN